MRDESGAIIYIGKAKNLKNRVSSYFQNSEKLAKVQAMTEKISDLDFFITPTEEDALVLENNLVKKHQPFYNILLKDSKTFPYIKVNLSEKFPQMCVTRRVVKAKNTKYFGPFLGGVYAGEILKMLCHAYPLRTCKNMPKKACLNYHIGLCHAPCEQKITQQEYHATVEKAIAFLNGNDDEMENVLHEKMALASLHQNFELAIAYRDFLLSLDKLKQKKITDLPNSANQDVVGYYSNGVHTSVCLMFVRGGKIMGLETVQMTDASLTEGETLSKFLSQFYQSAVCPPKLVLSHKLEDEEFFLKKYPMIELVCPQKGVQKRLTEMAVENAENGYRKNVDKAQKKYGETLGALELLKDALKLKNLPYRMECYDISHTGGVEKTASMAVFLGGEPAKKHYRKFKIRTVLGVDDFASLREVLERRFSKNRHSGSRQSEETGHGAKTIDENIASEKDSSFSELPDLVVIDGGKGQLSAVLGLWDVPPTAFISLAERFDEVYLPNQPEPVILKKGSMPLRLLQNIRDEAHRFAITFHRERRSKKMLGKV